MSDDLISRQAVKNKYRESLIHNLTDNNRGIDLSKYAEEPYKAFCKFIDSIPSVTPQPKTGHWIDDEFGSKCSCCGIYTHLDKFERPMKFKCRSMCGAKMV